MFWRDEKLDNIAKTKLIEMAHGNLDLDGFEALRAAGRVTRYHQLPRLAQRVDQHSWGVATILLHLWPNSEARVIKAALYHDVGEYKTGDIPAQVKWRLSEATRTEIDFIEEEGHTAVTGHGWFDLDPVERNRVKIADQLELMRWCLEVMREGDRAYAWAPFWRVAGLLLKEGRAAIDSVVLPFFDTMTDEAMAYIPHARVLDPEVDL